MRRIIFVTNDFAPMVGGVANHIWNLASSLVKLGCEIKVLHICYSDHGLNLNEQAEFDIIRVVVTKELAGKSSFTAKLGRYIASMTVAKKALDNLAGSFRPHVIHWHDYYHSSLTTKVFSNRSALLICSNHASQFLEQFDAGALYREYLKRIVSHADGIIGTSIELAEKSKIAGKPVRFIPNGVNEEIFKPEKKFRNEIFSNLNISSETKLILAPRRIDKKNGLDVLIRAIPAVLQNHPDLVFVIAGGGPDSLVSEYKSLAEQMNISDHLIFTGALKYEDMPQLIASADMVVIPSYLEAVSLSALEALASGVPVIASDVGGLPFVVNEKNGAIFKCGSHQDLAHKLILHLNDWQKTLKKGSVARQEILESFTWRYVALETLAFYDDVRSMKQVNPT